MRRTSFTTIAGLTLILAVTTVLQARQEYLTEVELDQIRDAQDIKVRIPTYLKFGERRMVALGLLAKKAEKPRQIKDVDGNVVDDTAEFKAYTNGDLLRGYAQILEEVMNNIDDAFTRRLEVRDGLEELLKFTETTLPLLEKFQAKGSDERSALEQAVEKAHMARDGSTESLKKIPKTEKKKR